MSKRGCRVTVIEAVAGFLLVTLGLIDVFVSILIPGTSRGWPSAAMLVHKTAVPAWRSAVRHRKDDSRARYANLFAPLLLATVVGTWLAVLLGVL